MKTIASLLAGMSIVMVERIITDQGNKIRLSMETDSEDHLGSSIDIPEEVLPKYESDIRALFYRQDPPFDLKTDIAEIDEPEEEEDENRADAN